jgi:elongation factor G
MATPDPRTRFWLIEIAIEPKTRADRERLNAALATLAADDTSLIVSTDPESSQTVIGGMTEQQPDDAVSRLRHTYGIDANVGALQVAYREKITQAATVDYTSKKQIGGSGQYARVKIVIEPLPPGDGFVFENQVVGGAVPTKYIPSIEKALESMLGSGVIAGFPVIDLKVSLVDGAYHDLDSSVLPFEIAARIALREALQNALPVLLEPIMKVEVVTPKEYVGSIISDLNLRRGQIQGQDIRSTIANVTAMVPLANIFSYADSLRSISQGRATATMQFDHYASVLLPEDNPPFRPAAAMRA